MGQPPGSPTSHTSHNGFEIVKKSVLKITNANNKVDSSQSHRLMYLGGNNHNHKDG